MKASFALFFLFLGLYFLFLNLYMKNQSSRGVEIAYHFFFLCACALLVISPGLFILRIYLGKKGEQDFFLYAKENIFCDGKIERSEFTRLLGIQDENLRDIGFNYTHKYFSFDDLIQAFRNISRNERKTDMKLDLEKIYEGLPFVKQA
jgi:hypothetical protein